MVFLSVVDMKKRKTGLKKLFELFNDQMQA